MFFCGWLLFEVEGEDVGFDEEEGGGEAVGGVDAADAGFDFGGVGEGLEEFVGGHANGLFVVEFVGGGEDVLAGEEGKDSVANPGLFEEEFAAVGVGHEGGLGSYGVWMVMPEKREKPARSRVRMRWMPWTFMAATRRASCEGLPMTEWRWTRNSQAG